MRLFWRHGYEGTSLKALTAAMGVTPPSLYAAFGDKKALFHQAVRRYLAQAPQEPASASAREAAQRLLQNAVLRYTGADTPAGCLVASAAASGSPDAAEVQDTLAKVRRTTENALFDHIRRDVEAGLMAADTDAEALAAHVMAVVQGLSVLARDGAPRAKLMKVAGRAMAAWPAA